MRSPPGRQDMTPNKVWDEINISQLAKDLDITRMAIYRWRRSERGIPDRRIIQIEQATGIDRAELRPDLYKR